MVTEQSLLELKKEIEGLRRDIKSMSSKKTWVTFSVVQDATGWDSKKLRKYREGGLINYKHENGNVKYLLESIPTNFLKTA